LFILFAVLTFAIVFAISTYDRVTVSNAQQTTLQQNSKGKVFVMYAASLIKTLEQTLGPSFEKKTGYAYTGEGRGSVQIANMIIDGQRKPDVFVSAGTIPIMKLMNNVGSNQQQQDLHQPPLAQWLVKFASAEMVIAYSPISHFHLDLDKAKTGRIPCTIPEATVSNLAGAVSFVTFLVSSDGQRILQSQGLDYIKPIAEGKQDKIPIAIKNMISMTNVVYINR
jgi:ABC-type molybdate transport system substrate-binding protein